MFQGTNSFFSAFALAVDLAMVREVSLERQERTVRLRGISLSFRNPRNMNRTTILMVEFFALNLSLHLLYSP